jgi:hypothetical protein
MLLRKLGVPGDSLQVGEYFNICGVNICYISAEDLGWGDRLLGFVTSGIL